MCEASVFCWPSLLDSEDIDPSAVKLHHVECNYRRFHPLESTFLFIVQLLPAEFVPIASFARGPNLSVVGPQETFVRLACKCLSFGSIDPPTLHSESIATFVIPRKDSMYTTFSPNLMNIPSNFPTLTQTSPRSSI